MTVVKFVRRHPDAKLPAYATPGAAGFDLVSIVERSLPPGVAVLIRTGLAVEIPEGFELQVRPRSGLALKEHVTVLNSPGTIDADYRGEVGVLLINHGSETFRVYPGDRIAQGVLARVERGSLIEVPAGELTATKRGEGGFGSTGRAS